MSSDASSESPLKNFSDKDQNKAYIEGLLLNLSITLDRWIVTGSKGTRERAYNIMQQIARESLDTDLIDQSVRMAKRASMPIDDPNAGIRISKRKIEAQQRKEWEREQQGSSDKKPFVGNIAGSKPLGRSALSNRATANGKPDAFMPTVDANLDPKRLEKFADSKKGLEDELARNIKSGSPAASDNEPRNVFVSDDAISQAEARTSEIIAKAGAGSAFQGDSLGIGGLEDVLAQIKRRIWVPLAAPPSLLKELGINPVRGLLLYGLPGCGKTLLARSLGKILSPARPVTVVSGPEIMDKFVGSSEANLRHIFDSPPEIYDNFRIGTRDNGSALSKVALHVIVLDEFDAMARSRGGSGSGDQGDAGVARDSVVNQLLAKMDGVDPLIVPTLVIGLTNRRTLIEPALLRPGRFEVQIEVPKPKTVAQRVSILTVHTTRMFQAGRVYVSDAPTGTAAARRLNKQTDQDVPSYDELLDFIAVECNGMSGASLAGVARAAASRALERAVYDFAGHGDTEGSLNGFAEDHSISDCLVTKTDFEDAIEDVLDSSRGGDGGEEEDEKEDEKAAKKEENEEKSDEP